MNLKEYIRSGIVESYVLGLATDDERREFEQMCATYPEVAEARDLFEQTLETEMLKEAMPPPPAIKEKVLQSIGPAYATEEPAENHSQTPVRRMNPWKWVAAASIVVAVAAGIWAYTLLDQKRQLVAQQQETEDRLNQSVARLDSLQQDADLLRKPMMTVSLTGTDVAPQAHSTIFWDSVSTKDVYLLVNNLPQPPSDKQYQLWALLDGQPIDLGFINYQVEQKRLLIKMQNVKKAQAFAITLEPRTGDPATPEGEMYVKGDL